MISPPCSTTTPDTILVIDDAGAGNAAELNVHYATSLGPFTARAWANGDGKVIPEIFGMYFPGFWLSFNIISNGTQLQLNYWVQDTATGDQEGCTLLFVRE